jgi:YVTN family beta-propeller protein
MLKSIRVQKMFFLTLIVLIAAFSVTLYAGDIPRTLYVINGSAETLSKMNMESGAIVPNIINTGQIPNRILTHNDLIYVVNSGTDNIMVIDPQNDGTVFKTIALEVGNNPWQMSFVNSNRAYVTNFKGNSVSVINVETGVVLKDIAVGTGPEGILVVDNKAYIANTGYVGWGEPWEQASISVIDITADSVIHTLDVPVNAQDLALAPDGKLHVVCTGNYADIFGKIAVIDINAASPAVTDTIDIGSSPGDIEITPSGIGYCVAWGDGTNGFLYSYNALADTVIHGDDDPILIGPNVSQLLYDSEENVLWIPYMTEWAGDGFVQKFDVEAGSVTWTSGVLGNGTNALVILEAIITSIDDPFYSGQPDHFDLHQNYPNPFNPSTAISYQISTLSQVELVVYNISGQKVRTLVNEQQTAGNYTISFDATGISSGIYFYKLKAGNSTQIRRMVLIR